jgi:micrococcal nuclease
MPRRYPRRPQRSLAVWLLLAAFVIWRAWQEFQPADSPQYLDEGVYHVERVVDGDTLLLENQARIRLQGVDTPETVKPDFPEEPWGREASQFTKEFVGDGAVVLTFDLERLDKYGRFLAYVSKDELMLNEELIRAGLATAELGFRYSDAMKRRFETAENEAKAARRGIWSDAPPPTPTDP